MSGAGELLGVMHGPSGPACLVFSSEDKLKAVCIIILNIFSVHTRDIANFMNSMDIMDNIESMDSMDSIDGDRVFP